MVAEEHPVSTAGEDADAEDAEAAGARAGAAPGSSYCHEAQEPHETTASAAVAS